MSSMRQIGSNPIATLTLEFCKMNLQLALSELHEAPNNLLENWVSELCDSNPDRQGGVEA